MSASGKMSCGFLPPSSMETFFSVAAPAAAAARPTVVEPVNEIMSTSGSVVMGAPTSGPYPVTTLQAPSGRPASASKPARCKVEAEVISLGFTTHVQPAASANGSFCETISSGKFHGVMIETTPIGSLNKAQPVRAEIGVALARKLPRQGRGVAPDVGRALDFA